MGSGLRLIRFALVPLLALAVPALLPVSAFAAEPTIESVSVSHITANDATLEARIGPGGLETTYQFGLESGCGIEPPEPGHANCLVIAEHPLPSGVVSAAAGTQTVRLDLNQAGVTLHPGSLYRFGIKAANSAGAATESGGYFTATSGAPPTIESEAVSHLTPTHATVEAAINPDGLETTYEFWLQFANCQNGSPGAGVCDSISIQRVGDGTLPPGSSGQSVSADLNHLQPGYAYTFWAVATNSSGETVGEHLDFTAPAGNPPSIESISLSHLTPTDATLEAQIDTEGLQTAYEFELSHVPCSEHGSGCELAPTPIPLPSGELLGSFIPQTVSIDLNSAGVTLGPGEWFYSVSATSAAGSAEAPWQVFEAPSPGSLAGSTLSNSQVSLQAVQPPTLSSNPQASHRNHHRHHRRRPHRALRAVVH
jgi:hypothetical protein